MFCSAIRAAHCPFCFALCYERPNSMPSTKFPNFVLSTWSMLVTSCYMPLGFLKLVFALLSLLSISPPIRNYTAMILLQIQQYNVRSCDYQHHGTKNTFRQQNCFVVQYDDSDSIALYSISTLNNLISLFSLTSRLLTTQIVAMYMVPYYSHKIIIIKNWCYSMHTSPRHYPFALYATTAHYSTSCWQLLRPV